MTLHTEIEYIDLQNGINFNANGIEFGSTECNYVIEFF